MLERYAKLNHGSDASADQSAGMFDLATVLDFGARNGPVMAICAAVMAACALGVAVTTPPKYTSTARILIDTKAAQLGTDRVQQSGDPLAVSAGAESQVELISSSNVVSSAVRKLGLVNDPEYTNPPSSLVSGVRGAIGGVTSGVMQLFSSSKAAVAPDPERGIVDGIIGGLTVRRLGLTFIIEMTYSGFSPVKTAQLVNAIADAYITDELEAKFDATKRAGLWLQDRVNELKDQSTAADRAVEEYRSKNNLVDTNRGTVTEQQIAEVNSQIILARTATAEAKAKLDRLNQVLDGNIPDATVTDALHSEIVNNLRGQLLELQRRQAEWARRYGDQHQAVISLREEITRLQKSLRDELERISETFKSDFEITKARELSLENAMVGLVSNNSSAKQAMVRLHELESSAAVYHKLYEAVLQRYTEVAQQQSFPLPEARLISPAVPALGKSSPVTTAYMFIGGVLGVLMGAGVGLIRIARDKSFRTPIQVESTLGIQCLASVPLLTGTTRQRNIPPALQTSGRMVAANCGYLRQAFDDPFSAFAESVRAIKLSLDLERSGQKSMVVGVVSSIPGEGKSLIASNLAQIIGQSGHRCILVDCDLRRPSLSKSLARNASAGLLDLLAGADTEKVVYQGGWSKFAFVPCAKPANISGSDVVINSTAMQEMITRLRESYDFIILDLPPLVPVVDARAAAPVVDKFLMVVEWGQTDRTTASEAVGLLLDHAVGKVAGAVLSKVDVRVARRYSTAYAKYYHSAYHSHYVKSNSDARAPATAPRD